MKPIDLVKAESDLRAYSAGLGATLFTYSQVVAAIASQVRRAHYYRLPPGGYFEAQDDPSRQHRATRIMLPSQQLVLAWTDANCWHLALCFETSPSFPARGCMPGAWPMYHPREFSPRRGDIAIVSFGYVGNVLVPPTVAIVFGADDYFWRGTLQLRSAISVRGSLCLANPRVAVLSSDQRRQLDAGRITHEELYAPCASAAGVLESFVTATRLQAPAPANPRGPILGA